MFWLALSNECPSLTDVEDCSVSSINVSVLFVCHLLLAKFNQHLYCIYSFVNQQTLLPRVFFSYYYALWVFSVIITCIHICAKPNQINTSCYVIPQVLVVLGSFLISLALPMSQLD